MVEHELEAKQWEFQRLLEGKIEICPLYVTHNVEVWTQFPTVIRSDWFNDIVFKSRYYKLIKIAPCGTEKESFFALVFSGKVIS